MYTLPAVKISDATSTGSSHVPSVDLLDSAMPVDVSDEKLDETELGDFLMEALTEFDSSEEELLNLCGV